MRYTIEEIAGILHAESILTTAQSTVSRLLTDSRSLSFPEETLFFAIKTKHGDGHKYIEELYRKGVRNFVVNSAKGHLHLSEANFIVTNDSLAALQALASHHRPILPH